MLGEMTTTRRTTTAAAAAAVAPAAAAATTTLLLLLPVLLLLLARKDLETNSSAATWLGCHRGREIASEFGVPNTSCHDATSCHRHGH